jgi:hypothetical protein
LLAHNLAANATNGEKTVHEKYLGPTIGTGQGDGAEGLRKAGLGHQATAARWLIIIYIS